MSDIRLGIRAALVYQHYEKRGLSRVEQDAIAIVATGRTLAEAGDALDINRIEQILSDVCRRRRGASPGAL